MNNRHSYLSSTPLRGRPDSQQNCPEIKQDHLTTLSVIQEKLMTTVLQNTYKHFVTDNVFQVELSCYFFQCYSVICL